ncbi:MULTISPECIES: hypothetical protein [unclassified Pseudomonas syringae group]|uniref:hypothetical protein n=1 Tax=unclassified Pseudomonas syringae group TaxID=2775504 RepID=UPI002908F41E|nr:MULTISPECIES: hypothetical protein [unclassified Pseudomonas syringae group]MDU8628233.1 hypothetical protein [Pseudomonas syringae group sp. 243L2]MDU8644384.1 hypothetical protein [Pseudomonas syringae group sp. 26L6]
MKNTLKKLLIAVACLAAAPAFAACQMTPVAYDMPSQRLDEALQQLAHRSGCPVKVDLGADSSRKVKKFKGTFTPDQALWLVLKKTGLEGYVENDGLTVDRRGQDFVNQRATELRTAIDEAGARMEARKKKRFLHQLDTIESGAKKVVLEQSFVSAAEMASYKRDFDELSSQIPDSK